MKLSFQKRSLLTVPYQKSTGIHILQKRIRKKSGISDKEKRRPSAALR